MRDDSGVSAKMDGAIVAVVVDVRGLIDTGEVEGEGFYCKGL